MNICLHDLSIILLTSNELKLPSKVGLFTKGKASSPYRRRACMYRFAFRLKDTDLIVPDLCFSELRFLDGHRQPRECADRSEQAHNGRKRHKGLEQNEEFSKFFAAKESPSKPQPTNRATIGARRQYKPSNSKSPIKAPNVRLHSTSQPSLRAIDLPGRPFLGFGGRAPHSSSPVRPTIDVKPGSSPIKVRGGPISPLPQDQLPWPQSPIAPRMDLRRSAVMEKSDKVSSKHKADFTQQQGKSPTVHDGEANQAIEEMPTTANDVPRPNERIAPRSKLTLMQDQSAPTITKTISNNKTNDEHRRLFRHFATSSAHGTAVEDAVPLSDKEVPSKRYNIPAKSGLMDYLGEMIEERVGKEVQAALRPNNHPTIAPNETPMQMVDKRNEADHPTGQGKANLVDRQSEVEPPIKQGRHSSKHIERSDDQATPHNEKYGVRYDLGVHKVDKVCTETIDPDVPEQESVTIAQHPDVLTKRKANMPFPNIRASHLGLSLFMSPDSIYERQMQEDSFSQSPSVSTWGVSHLPSPILNRQSVSRSTFRPLSRHSAIARSRLSTARNRHNSIHQSISSNGPAGSLVAFYQTPSLSSFSPAAARGHAPFAPGSSERGRVLAASKRHQAETPQATSSQRQPPFAHEYEQQYSTVLEHEMHPNEPDQYPPTDFSPLPDNTFDAMPLRAEPSEFPHDDLNAPEVFEEEPLSPDVAMDYAAEVPAQHQNDAADEDFPADFWTPNKLY